MKKYDIGDDILVKGKVYGIDDSGTYQYLVDFDKPFGNNTSHYWVKNDYIVDELPTAEPVKPVLPKDVADEMEKAKEISLNLYGYLNSKFPLTHSFVFDRLSERDERIKILSDAWYNGYTVEKEPVYNLILGFDPDESDRRLCNALYKNHGELSIDAATDTYDLRGDDDYQFTQEEIDKYNKSFWIKNIDLNDYKVEVVADDSKDC
ncbi:DUF1642 domain-containing protein [Lapidilactobacillus dextrinicus]|uniref:DUF1642 domain-containing protein n=1 Tax=Lapidilactobacillus dextrinicus TaxID=51664 RepID=UPI003F22E917